jgi:putative membrane protein
MHALRFAPLLLVVFAAPALAHAGEATSSGWSFDPLIIAPLLFSLALFVVGTLRLRGRAARGASRLDRRTILFLTGWLILAGAVVSPLHIAGARSFAAHMLEHELLMLAAAPLLVLAEPLAVMLWALPAAARRTAGAWSRSTPVRWVWRRATDPVVATLVQAGALWLWHIPALFDRALVSPVWHIAQHLSFLVSALLFWTAVFPARPRNRPVAVLCLFATSLVSGALGAMMAFAQSPWYLPYVRLGMAPNGLSALEDQQLAGMLMWVPGGLVHALAALAAMGQLLKSQPEEPFATATAVLPERADEARP